jgi:tetratricopeptide (TPR) repeat protein
MTANRGDTKTGRVVYRNPAGVEITEGDLTEEAPRDVVEDASGGGTIPEMAVLLHQQGREAGGSGDVGKAIELFMEAHALAPRWPYPLYDAAFTYLLNNDTEQAERYYAMVDALAPRGFFTSKTSLDIVRREKKGELSPGFARMFASLEWMDDADEKRKVLEQITDKFPFLAPAWKELSALLDDDSEKLHAINQGLASAPDIDVETKGILTINKALIMSRRDDYDTAVRLLGDLILDPHSTLGSLAMAKMTLASIFASRTLH